MTDEVAAASGQGTRFLNFARGAKGVALLLFLLPWMTVSCAGQTLATMSGLDLATGSITVHNPMTGVAERPPGGGEIDLYVLIAAIAIAAVLVASFLLPRALATLAGIAGSAVAAALIGYSVLVRLPARIRADAEGGGASAGMSQAELADILRVDVAIGFWLTLAALVAAILLNWLARTR